MDKRKFLRFNAPLEVKAVKENREYDSGIIKDFSREGLKAVFNNFDFEPDSRIELDIQRPAIDVFIPGKGEVRWKREIKGKWEVGIKLLELPPYVKGEILDYGYRRWVKDKV